MRECVRDERSMGRWTTSSQTQPRRRYRRYRVFGLLPALVIVAGGLYLGTAMGNWIPLAAGCCSW